MKILKLVLTCVAVALFGAAALAQLPHALRGQPLAGQVVDADTGQPIAGVHVAYIWESTINPSGFTGHNSRTICYHAAATVTDHNGRFSIPRWRKWSTYDVDQYGPTALVYARHYVPQQISLGHSRDEPDVERRSERYVLKAFSGAATERLDVMWAGVGNQGCMYGGESQKSLFAMQKAMYEEARQIARTDGQREKAHSFAAMAADAALAADPNGPSNAAQVETFIKENLR